MDVATYLFSLEDISADDLRWAKRPWEQRPHCPALSIKPLDLAHLGEVLGLGSHDSILGEFSLLAGESQEAPWVVSLPPELVFALRNIGRGDWESVAARWGQVDEVGEEYTPNDLLRFLGRAAGFLEEAGDPVVLYVTTIAA